LKIEHKKDETVYFKNLEIGDTFYYQGGYEKRLYIKISNMYNCSALYIKAVDLVYNILNNFEEETKVEKVTCRVVVE